jgi:hypothetical protein
MPNRFNNMRSAHLHALKLDRLYLTVAKAALLAAAIVTLVPTILRAGLRQLSRI